MYKYENKDKIIYSSYTGTLQTSYHLDEREKFVFIAVATAEPFHLIGCYSYFGLSLLTLLNIIISCSFTCTHVTCSACLLHILVQDY